MTSRTAPPATRPASARPRAARLGLGVAFAHFLLAWLALRAVVAGTAAGGAASWAAVLVAVLGVPLLYTPWRPTLGGLLPAGLLVAVLNAVLWGLAAAALARWRSRRRTGRDVPDR